MRHYARRARGKVFADFAETDTTFQVVDAVGLDGPLETTTIAGVKNVHKWAGTEDGEVKIEWNQSTGEWEAYQIDCSENQPPTDPEAGGGGGGV